jgi:hypothetical protein
MQNYNKYRANYIWYEQCQGLLKLLLILDYKWYKITINFIIKLPISNSYKDIMIISNRLSKGMILVPCE